MGRSIRIQASFIHPNVSALATDAGVITKRSACEKTSAGRAGSPLPAAIANPRVRIYHGGAHGAPHLSYSYQELLYWRAHFLMAPQPLGWELGQWILN